MATERAEGQFRAAETPPMTVRCTDGAFLGEIGPVTIEADVRGALGGGTGRQDAGGGEPVLLAVRRVAVATAGQIERAGLGQDFVDDGEGGVFVLACVRYSKT